MPGGLAVLARCDKERDITVITGVREFLKNKASRPGQHTFINRRE